jgi:RNA polymerase sigma factor (sigma-70 family)
MKGTIFPEEKTVASLLEAWQTTGDPDDYRRLWNAASAVVESVVRKNLYRHGIRDPAAAAEAVSLVMNHLRRLPDQGVAKFDRNQTAAGYLVWLSSRRSRDVARSLRRRRESSLDDTRGQIVEPLVDPDIDHIEGSDSRAVDHLYAAIKALDDRSRLVIERHLAGEPQAVTAKALRVCDGTITRIRQRAIQRLRELMTGGAIALRRSKPR